MAFTFDVEKEFGSIGKQSADGMQKSLNLVSWNGKKAKYDIRPWDESKGRCGKGITFTKDEMVELKEILNKINFDE